MSEHLDDLKVMRFIMYLLKNIEVVFIMVLQHSENPEMSMKYTNDQKIVKN